MGRRGGGGGFTIIELVITLVVFSVLTVAAVDGGRNLIMNNRISAVSMDLMTALNYTRIAAMKMNRAALFEPLSRGSGDEMGNGWVIWTDLDGNNAMTPPERLQVHEEVDDRITIAATGAKDRLEFLPDGSLGNGTSATYRICDSRKGEEGREITVLVSGRIRGDPVICD